MSPKPPAATKLRCIERELAYRRRVYPRLVAQGKMAAGAADHEIAVMQAIRDDYHAAAEREGQLSLFAAAE